MLYILTINCQQKTSHVNKDDLDAIIYHLKQCGVEFHIIRYENSGKYSQLHIHSLASYNGSYKKLTQYGDARIWKSFQVNFKKITGSAEGPIAYINKEDSLNALTENYFKNKYFNQSTQEYEPLML